MGQQPTQIISASFVNPNDQTVYQIEPNSQWLFYNDSKGDCCWVDNDGYVFVQNEEGVSEYLNDASGNYQKIDRASLEPRLQIIVNHTKHEVFSDTLYYSGGYQTLATKKESDQHWRSYEYTNPVAICRALNVLKNTASNLYNDANLSAFQQIANQRKEQLLAKHQRAAEHIEIDLAEYSEEIENSKQERFTLIKVNRDGKDRYIKLNNRLQGTDASLTQAIAAEFFRRYFHAPKSRLVYVKGTNEVIGVEFDALEGIPLDEYFRKKYNKLRDNLPGLKPCVFGYNGNYKIEYPKQIIDELVAAGLNVGYLVGVIGSELDARWGNFIIDPKTKELGRIDFDMTFADHVFGLQQNPLFDDSFCQVRECDVSQGYDIVAAELAEGFCTLGKASAYRPHRWMKAHAFGNGKDSNDGYNEHPDLAKKIDSNENSKLDRYKGCLDFILTPKQDIERLVTPFTRDPKEQETKIQEIINRIKTLKDAMLAYADFQAFLQSENADKAIKTILAEKLDYYLDPLESVTFTKKDIRGNITAICKAYQNLTGKTVPEMYLDKIFVAKAGYSYTTDKVPHGMAQSILFPPVNPVFQESQFELPAPTAVFAQ